MAVITSTSRIILVVEGIKKTAACKGDRWESSFRFLGHGMGWPSPSRMGGFFFSVPRPGNGRLRRGFTNKSRIKQYERRPKALKYPSSHASRIT